MNHLKVLKSLGIAALLVGAGISNEVSAQTCPASNEVTISVIPEATITAALDPSSTGTVCVGGGVIINATPSGGTGTCTVQWQESSDGTSWTDMAGRTGNTLTLTGLAAGTKHYRAKLTCTGGGCDEATSPAVTITVNPVLTVDDLAAGIQDIVECVVGTGETGQALTVTTTGGSGAALTYQWQKSTDGGTTFTDISGATSASYTPDASVAGVTHYRVKVTDASSGCGTATSRTISVDVKPDISIGTQPIDIAECVGGTDQLSVIATGGKDPLTYQWQTSSSSTGPWTDVSGATATTYQPSSNTTDVGTTRYYRVVVSSAGNACGSKESNAAKVEIFGKPAVAVTVPPSTTVCEGGTITLNATPSGGTGTCTIQWQKKATGDADFNDIGGATGTSYTTPTLSTSNDNTKYRARYSCSASGCCN